MRKIGAYVQVTSDPDIRAKLLRIRPAVVLLHLDGGDLGGWIRQALPETFIIGRLYWTEQQQNDMMLIVPGADVADQVLAQKGADACHAFMLFNEFLTSPHKAGWVSYPGAGDYQKDNGWKERCDRYDQMQVDFLHEVKRAGKEAIAFNFAAANWAFASWYLQLQPLTCAAYTHFGFHSYAWPTLTSHDWHSNFAETMQIVDDFSRHTCILTEVAVTRMHAQPGHPDEGWLSQGDGAPLSLDAYASDLSVVNAELCKRPNVMGACLFNAAPDGKWTTFAVTPDLVTRLAALPECEPVAPPVAEPVRLRMPFDHANPVSRVSQWYGERPEAYKPWAHEGIDFALNAGYDVRAVCDGVVDAFKASGAYGTYVRILSEGELLNVTTGATVKGKWQTVYAHLSKRTVKAGQVVKAGEKIGEAGSTGNSTGNHLHFGLRLPGQKPSDPYWGYSDPAPWLGLKRVSNPTPPSSAAQLIEQAMALLVKAKELIT